MALVIAAPASNSGKTLLTILLSCWARKKGTTIQTFKVGPDYLDPQLLTSVSGKPCRNLDSILCGDNWVKESFNGFGGLTELAIIEGVMGLFDGIGYTSEGSTADIAKLLNLPILLVIDGHGQARSIAALVKGFKDFDKRLNIAGVVLNNINSSRHEELLVNSLSTINVKVLGCIPKNDCLKIKNKSLGLIPAHEIIGIKNLVNKWAEIADKYLNIPLIYPLLKAPKVSSNPIKNIVEATLNNPLEKETSIAIASDKAFHFTYADTKDCLKEMGMKVINWEPIKNISIPKEAKALIIPGGFPENFAEEISHCEKSLSSIRDSFCNIPIYAECGGMIMLGESVVDSKGNKFPMAGLLPFQTKKGSLKVGYRKLNPITESPILKKGQLITGHEFHRWEIENKRNNHMSNNIAKLNSKKKHTLSKLWEAKGWEVKSDLEGWASKYFHASWIHLHWASSPNIIRNWANIINLKS